MTDKYFGTLYGVSVGPGDPELITLKAKSILENCRVLAIPVTHKGNTFALDIVRKITDISGKELLFLPFQMISDEEKLRTNHKAQAETVEKKLEKGEDVVFASLGDVSVYSTFAYIGNIIKEKGYAVKMIPGVTSFCASACALGISLTAMRQPLHIIPAGFGSAESALALSGVKVLMKSANQFPAVRRAVSESGQSAYAVEDCGMDSQALYHKLEDMPYESGYFTTIIVKEE